MGSVRVKWLSQTLPTLTARALLPHYSGSATFVRKLTSNCRTLLSYSSPSTTHRRSAVRALVSTSDSITKMVKAIKVHELGGPEVLKWEDVEIGQPGEGEILVKNKAIGLNFIDTYFRKGVYQPAKLPFTPGMEAVGEVIAVGNGVTDVKVGDIVGYAGNPMGAYAEEQILPVDRAVPVPPSIDPVVAASAMLKGMTAQFLLHRCFKVEPGHTILVHAAAGGVGSLLCQWGKSLGATVIGTVSTKEKAAQATEDGCHHVINYKEEDFVARVNEITSGKGVNVVYDSVGKDTIQVTDNVFPSPTSSSHHMLCRHVAETHPTLFNAQGSLSCLKIRGYLVVFGQSSGTPDPIPLSALAPKCLYLTRPSLMMYTTTREELLETAADVFANMESGALRVRVNHTYPLSEAAKAHSDLESRKTSGAIHTIELLNWFNTQFRISLFLPSQLNLHSLMIGVSDARLLYKFIYGRFFVSGTKSTMELLHDAAARSLTAMMYSKGHEPPMASEDCYYAAARRPLLEAPELGLPLAPVLEYSHTWVQDPAEHIKVNCLYEIDHSMLPNRAPDQLKSVRVVMVNEKTRMRVSLRYPSIYSIRAYFNDGTGCSGPEVKHIPMLDERCVIGSEVAGEALYRRILPDEVAKKKWDWNFWIVPSVASQKVSNLRLKGSSSTNNGSGALTKDSLLSELKTPGIVNWGQRRRVRFMGRHVEDKEEPSDWMEKNDKDDGSDGEEDQSDPASGEEECEEEEDTEEVIVKAKTRECRENLKRKKNQLPSSTIQLRKRPKRGKNKNQIVVYRQKINKKKKVVKKTIDRWSAERYQLAEVNMLKIMKEEKALFGNPMLRPVLRAKARRLIGDTGLLDHLLKHMAGKVAPGGEERFRRRHNAEGSMEYWLEKANLLDLRREAGVQDPYWIPPPGWKPGDNPSQDPVCATQIKKLTEQVEKLKRDMEDLASKKQEEELAIAAMPISSSLTTLSMEHDNLLTPLKEAMATRNRAEEKQLERPQQLEEETMTQLMITQSVEHHFEEGNRSQNSTTPTPMEDRAAKIQRLRSSGFRICKPGGTFLWPDMATASSPTVHLDGFLARTPSSVSSLSSSITTLTSADSQHSPSPLMRPVAERTSEFAIALTTPPSSSAVPSILRRQGRNNSATPRTPLINLNEVPRIRTENPIQVSPGPVTYQRRNHHQSFSAGTMAAASCLPLGVQTWLAIGGGNPSSEKDCKRG
ncbi:unnamed protein product [Linum tenue]|uniref:Enoyl reductase (ER) domain-containing protein n=1 Tax=Linum tenue TaxID=586396 RepID=A0AAV0J3T1_9ROSI|nr:unnamed protein product [Linum tenue]